MPPTWKGKNRSWKICKSHHLIKQDFVGDCVQQFQIPNPAKILAKAGKIEASFIQCELKKKKKWFEESIGGNKKELLVLLLILRGISYPSA